MSFKFKVLSGAIWSLIEKGGQQVISLLVFIVVSRILGPESYGIANICFLYYSLTIMIIAGLLDGVVSKQINNPKNKSTLFWGVFILGMIIATLSFTTSPVLAKIMNEKQLQDLLKLFSVVPILLSTIAVPNALILKELDIKIFAIRTTVSTLFGGIVGITLAIKGYGAYAIVWQQISQLLVANLLVWGAITWRPSLYFSRTKFLTDIKPGLSFLGNNIIALVDEQVPRLLISYLLGLSALGHFAFSTRIKFAITNIFVTAPLTVAFPALSKLNESNDKQLQLSMLASYVTSLTIFPLLTISILTAPIYVPWFFGNKWNSAIPVLQIYLTIIYTTPIILIIKSIFRARSKMSTFILPNIYILLTNIAMTSLLFLENGLILMSCGILAVNTISVFYFSRLLQIDISPIFHKVLPEQSKPLLASFIGAAITYSLNLNFNFSDKSFEFMSIIAIFLLVYIALIMSWDIKKLTGIRQLVKTQ